MKGSGFDLRERHLPNRWGYDILNIVGPVDEADQVGHRDGR